MTGILGARGKHGGYAEYLKIPARQLVSLPENIPWPDGAVCCDAGCTSLHAVDRARVQLGETVVVIGMGGVGSVVSQLAKAAGARVVAVVRSERRAQRARDRGADEVLNSREVDIPKAIQNLTDGLGADCVIDCVGNEETMTYGVDSLRHGGRLVIVGYTPERYPLNGKLLAQNELEIIGTRCGRMQDLINTVRLVAEGKVKSIVTDLYPLEEANEALAFLRAGKVLGRVVLLTPAGRQTMERR
jgi:2-desacetyl-2-hydroxyethyl bacteriochlorophyllide A dehydrogenase